MKERDRMAVYYVCFLEMSYKDIDVGLAGAIMFKILWFSLRTFRYDQNDRL